MMEMLILEEEEEHQLPLWVLAQEGGMAGTKDAGSDGQGDVSGDSKQLLALQEKLLQGQQQQQQGKWEEAWLQAEEFGEEGDAPVLLRRPGTQASAAR